MKKLFYLLSLALMTGSFQSCNNDAEIIDTNTAKVYMKVIPTVEGETLTRAAKSSWTNGDKIGWYLSNGNETTYMGFNYMNKGLTYTSSWALDETPQLTGIEGTLYAYYPWTAGLTSFERISVSTANQTDYMWGKVTGLKATNATANLTMYHALSQLKVIIKKGTYKGTGSVTSLKVNSTNLSTSGKMNATSGAVTMDAAADIVFSGTKTLTDEGVDWSSIVVQTATAASPVFTVVIDGMTYSVTGSSFTPEAGKIATYTITCTSTGLTIANDVTIKTWDPGATGSGTLQ